MRSHRLVFDPHAGSEVMGSCFGVLVSVPRSGNDFVHEHDGVLEYDPRAGRAANPWWVILRCCDGLIGYHRRLVERRFGIRLNPPLFGAHISVVRGEEPPAPDAWRRHHGRAVTFRHTHKVFTNGEFWWLYVRSDDLVAVREELGLPGNGEYLHLTIGRLPPEDFTGTVVDLRGLR